MQMPELDGIETTKEIRKLEEFNNLVIIALTANAFSSDRENCFAAGMNGYLEKPLDMDKVEEILQLL